VADAGDGPRKTLELIAKALAQRYGQAHADKWLAEQQAKKVEYPKRASLLGHRNLPEIRPAAEFASVTQEPDALSSPRRPLEPLLRGKVPATRSQFHGTGTGVLPPHEPLEPIRRDTPFGAHSLPVSAPPPPPLSAGELSDRLTEPVAAELSPTAFRIYRTLHQVALEVARARGYVEAVTHVTFHIPAEMVAHHLGIHRCTLWRNLPELKRLGLVDARAHCTTVNNQTRNDGTVWKIKLRPKRGKAARLSYEDLKHQWRDLEADIRSGRTAYQEMQQSKPERESYNLVVEGLLPWALPPRQQKTPLNLTVANTSPGDLTSVLDVPHAQRDERGAVVDAAARSCACQLGDPNVDYYRWLFWQLLRLHDHGQDHFSTLYTMLCRVRADKLEGFARKPGALLTARLKEGGLWDLLRSTPAYRVGPKPIQA
jgi:hypothetical protein